jgi:phage tail-like protein
MDANGLRFWMRANESDWTLSKELLYDRTRHALRLSDLASGRVWPGDDASAAPIISKAPQTIDAFDRIAFAEFAAGAGNVKGMRSGGDPAAAKVIFTSAEQVTDIAVGAGAILYIATTTHVWLQDMHFNSLQRWKALTAADATGLKPFRLAADPEGGCWVLCQDGVLARVSGEPLPDLATERFATEPIRPVREDPKPPTMAPWFGAPVIAVGEKPVAICYSAANGVAIVAQAQNADAKLYLPLQGRTVTLTGMKFPTSAKWLDQGVLALLYPGATEAAIFDINRGFLMDLYPLNGPKQPVNEPFLQTFDGSPMYLRNGLPRRLEQVSLPSLATHGSAASSQPLDSGNSSTTWHRLYLEACIPPHCSIRVSAAASQSPDPATVAEWSDHYFGRRIRGAPSGTWLLEASEVPFQSGMLQCPSEVDRSGLFTVLLQRTGHRVSALRGRYLHLRVELNGSHQATPEIAALRAYGSRFSYLERYLPELYHETEFGPDADAPSQHTTAPDFLDRFLCIIESLLTPIEDRVASAYLLTNPQSTRDQDLDWLAGWLGVTFDPALPFARKRAWLTSAAEMSRWRGTLRGLGLALEAATGGGVSSGAIVIVENYRLRRVLATILGVDLTDYNDPLLPGADYGGNSIVGPTLTLGDEFQRAFLALFDGSLKVSAQEQAAINALFDNLAWRVTVLVHQDVTPQDLGLIRRVAGREAPAHVELTVATASLPFLAGLSSLIGVDTYLGPKPQPGPIRVGETRVGVWDVVQQPGSLDPAFEG